jgi:predicted ribonuclease YlaK
MRFLDTSSLLILKERLLDIQEPIAISSITLVELEKIKSSQNKSFDTKLAARRVIKILEEHPETFKTICYQSSMKQFIEDKELDLDNNDMKILACAVATNQCEDVTFVSNDLSLRVIAALFFDKEHIKSVAEETDEYTGYLDVYMTEEEMSDFYSNPYTNFYDLNVNEYINVYNESKVLVDTLCWTGEGYRRLSFKNFNSQWFGEVKPYKGDSYQRMLFDSLENNTFTLIRGKAGSGKSMISLAYLMYKLERHQIDKIIIFCNCVATKDTAKLGFYPGSKDEKLLDSQIGNFLIGKFGGIEGVEDLINRGVLMLVPMADCRGMDIGIRAGVYITEAQNTTVDTMKLVLQRVGEDCICIVEGDDKTQVDLDIYQTKNGLAKASQAFRGEDYYGEVTLKNCYRSKIANRAELMG